MDKLPDELLDRLCVFLERRDLWAVVRTSSRLRRLAMLPFLSRFGISQAKIQAGTLALSDYFFLILVVARISPIKRLVCFQDNLSVPYLRYKKLAAILSVTAPIPDILIYNRHYMLQKTRKEAAYLLAHIPSSATNTLVVVKGTSQSIYLSHPRSSPPIRWKLLPPPFRSFNLSTPMKVLIVMFGIPLLFAYLVSGVVNLAVLSMWVYRRLSRPPWPQEDRIVEDTGLLAFDEMRIQVLPEKRHTLVTVALSNWPTLVLRPVAGLTASAYSAILASLDLGELLQSLAVGAHADLVHPELMALLKRHPHLTGIHFFPDSLRSSSLTQMPLIPDSANKVQELAAPPPYIPFLLPAAPNVQRVSLHFTSLPPRVPNLRRTTFDLPAYRTALEALAALPGTHPIALSLAFRPTAASLPWHGLPDAEALAGDAAYPETRLARVNALFLSYAGSPTGRFRASDVHNGAFVRWLGLFPGVQRLSFVYGTLEKIPAAERAVLAEAICAACRGINTPRDIAFNISDD